MQFEYYVLNYDFNGRKVETFNIFRNTSLNDAVEKEVRKYLRSPSKYFHETFGFFDGSDIERTYGFDGFCETLETLIMWQEWGRREYEISVGDAFEENINKFEKWDCYKQCVPNIPMIAREIIWQYKQQLKKGRGLI